MGSASIRGVRYCFAVESASVTDLAQAGKIHSQPTILEEFGFSRVRIATTESPYELAVAACSELLAETGVDPESIGTLIWAGAGTPVAYTPRPSEAVSYASHRGLERFRYPGPRLQSELAMNAAHVFAVDQMGCNNLFAAVAVARSLVLAGDVERVLCVSAEFFPADAGREAVFNCTSDAVVALLVERGSTPNRIVAQSWTTRGFHWDSTAGEEELVASYFPTAQRVVRKAISRAGWTAGEVDWIIPHNVSERSWEVLSGLLEVSMDRVWTRNIARYGHTIAGDNFINLRDARDAGDVRSGQKLLLFSFAYGAHWHAMAVES